MAISFFDIAKVLSTIESDNLDELEDDLNSQLKTHRPARVERDSISQNVLEYLVVRYRLQGYEVRIVQEDSSVMVEVFIFRSV